MGGQLRVDLDAAEIAAPATGDEDRMLRINEALDALAARDALKAEVVKLRFFVGLNAGEIARVLGLNERTVDRHWAYARTWLFQHLQRQEQTGDQ
jgi:DNA-directed RNA polymerase specialized sigma24 family protein